MSQQSTVESETGARSHSAAERRHALVLGGTGYIGQEVLRGLACAAVPTSFTYYRSAERARALAEELHQDPSCVDLRDGAAIKACLEGLIQRRGCPDVVIHCAGIAEDRRLDQMDEHHWEEIFAVNVRSTFVVAKCLVGPMAAQGGGHFVLLAGLDAVQLVDTPVHFGASQGAIAGLMRALAKELGPQNILVNLVAFGPMGGGISKTVNARRQARFIKFSALGRLGTALDASRAILWLALENEAMTGTVVPVCGGA